MESYITRRQSGKIFEQSMKLVLVEKKNNFLYIYEFSENNKQSLEKLCSANIIKCVDFCTYNIEFLNNLIAKIKCEN